MNTVTKRVVNGVVVEYTINGVGVVRHSPVNREWPAALLPLKVLAKPGDRGAGDIIARVIGPIGGYAFKTWYRRMFGTDCGCGHRQEVLNARWPL
jgi:hypothetical protein